MMKQFDHKESTKCTSI